MPAGCRGCSQAPAAESRERVTLSQGIVQRNSVPLVKESHERREFPLWLFFHDFVIEFADIAWGGGFGESHGVAGVVVIEPGEHVSEVEAPTEVFAEGFDSVLDAFEDGAEVTVAEEAYEEFSLAVACASAETC